MVLNDVSTTEAASFILTNELLFGFTLVWISRRVQRITQSPSLTCAHTGISVTLQHHINEASLMHDRSRICNQTTPPNTQKGLVITAFGSPVTKPQDCRVSVWVAKSTLSVNCHSFTDYRSARKKENMPQKLRQRVTTSGSHEEGTVGDSSGLHPVPPCYLGGPSDEEPTWAVVNERTGTFLRSMLAHRSWQTPSWAVCLVEEQQTAKHRGFAQPENSEAHSTKGLRRIRTVEFWLTAYHIP